MSIHASSNYTVTLDDNGHVWWFGLIFRDNGETYTSEIPVQIQGLENIIEIACSSTFRLFLDSGGYVWYHGVLLQSSFTPVTKIDDFTNIIHISCSNEYAILLNDVGECFQIKSKKSYYYGELISVLKDIPCIIEISCGSSASYMLSDTGEVYGFGSNTFLQLSNYYTEFGRHIQKIIFPEKIRKISAGSNHFLALSVSGTVWGIGSNFRGKLGNLIQSSKIGTPSEVIFPEHTFIVAVETGCDYSLALDIEGNLWIFGKFYKQVAIPKPIILENIGDIETICHGLSNGIIIKTSDEIKCIYSAITANFGPILNKSCKPKDRTWNPEYFDIIGSNPYWKQQFKKIKSARK